MRTRIAVLAVAAVLIVAGSVMPGLRRRMIQDVITWDAPVRDPVELPGGPGQGLAPAQRVRVVLVDGLSASTAATMPTWTALCKRGISLKVDIGFPTVSLPVEVSLWTGLTQQQTGVVFRSDRPLVPPLDRRGIPSRVIGSTAVAENHGYIVRSLGFSHVEPESAGRPNVDREPDTWKKQWLEHALAAVKSDTRLAFVHVLRVDTAGHRKGRESAEYRSAAADADGFLAQLVAADPDARWFLLSDHGHLATGGHGGEDREVRVVEHCIFGPGITPATGGPVHLVDVSRALADSLGVSLDKHSIARPLDVALKHPLDRDQSVPALPLGTAALALFLLVLGIGASVLAVRRWWLAPWWFVGACLLLIIVRGVPSMSMPMVYAKESAADLFDFDRRLMMRAWLAMLPVASVCTWFGLRTLTMASLWRVLAGQLAVPAATLAATITACGAWGALLGAHVAPVAPHYTAFTSVLFLIVAQGLGAVALALLARTCLEVFGRRRAAETTQTATSAG